MTDKVDHILEYIGEDHPEFLNNDVVSKKTYLKSVAKYANELWSEAVKDVESNHEYCAVILSFVQSVKPAQGVMRVTTLTAQDMRKMQCQ